MDGSASPLEDIPARHEQGLRELARVLARDEPTAEDLLQETWLAWLRRPPRREGDLPAWLRTVLRNVASKRRRGEERRTRREERAAAEATDERPVDLELARAESHARILAALRALPEPYRGVLELRFLEELEPREIARRLGRPLNTVNSQLKRGLARLRTSLAREHGEDGLAGLVLLALFDKTEAPPHAPRAPVAEGSAGLVRALAGLVVVAGGATLALSWMRRDRAPERVVLARAEPERPSALERPASLDARATNLVSAEPSAGRASASATLEVSVVDPEGEPVEGARVRIGDASNRYRELGLTGADGLLRAQLSPADLFEPDLFSGAGPRVALVASAPGRITSDVHYALRAEDGPTRVALALGGPDLVLHGTVQGADGEPLAGAQVMIEAPRRRLEAGADGVLRRSPPLDASTGARGTFTIEGLEPGVLPMEITAAGHVPLWVWEDATGQRERSFVVRLARGATLTGEVRDAEGRVLAGAVVGYRRAPGLAPRTTRTDADGFYRLEGVEAGTHAFTCRAREGSGPWETRELALAAGEELVWNAVPARAERVWLELVDAAGEPLAGWFVHARAERVPGWEEAWLADERGQLDELGPPVGACLIELYASAWALSADGFPVASFAGVAPSAEPRTLTLSVGSSDRGEIAGRLVDADGEPFSITWIYVQDPERGTWRRAQGGREDGAFRLRNVPPGRHALFASLGPEGAFELGVFELLPEAVLELGALRAPRRGTLALDWRWEGEGLEHVLIALASSAGPTFTVLQGRGAPRERIALVPGDYGLQVARDGKLVQRRQLTIYPAENVELTTGPDEGPQHLFVVSEAAPAVAATELDLRVLRLDGEGDPELVVEASLAPSAERDWRFFVALRPGRYRIEAQSGTGASLTDEREITPSNEVRTITLALER